MKINKPLLLSLLLVTTGALADRPAMNDRSADLPMMDMTAPEQDSGRPASSEAALEDELVEPMDAPRAVAPEPETAQPVQTVTTTTGTALELQPGETLSVPVLDFPRRGMSMDKVQNELGEPLARSPTVGEPPITSWTYNDRVVYFEYSKVIHAVAIN